MIESNPAGGARSTITVFLADDNLIVREGVRALLGLEPDLEVAAALLAARRAGTGVGA